MVENPAKIMEGEPIGTDENSNSDAEVIGLKLDILGKELNLCIAVGQGQATLADIVPLARTLCDKITGIVVESVRGDGAEIPCRKGCPACCGPYLIPLSFPEVCRLNEEISTSPPHWREQILQTSLLAARRILSQKPPESFNDQTEDSSLLGEEKLNLVSDWYASLKLSCPFLCDGRCSIYDQRPLACREHFVKGSDAACSGKPGIAEVVRMPVNMPNALAQLAGELEGTAAESVMLPLALIWFEQNQQRVHRSWPAVMMVNRFLEIVKDMASKNSEAVVA
jgi:Fe-S-cluster containining protein